MIWFTISIEKQAGHSGEGKTQQTLPGLFSIKNKFCNIFMPVARQCCYVDNKCAAYSTLICEQYEYILEAGSARPLQWLGYTLGVRGLLVQFPGWAIFPSTKRPYRLRNKPSLFNWLRGLCPPGISAPSSADNGMSGAIPLSPPHHLHSWHAQRQIFWNTMYNLEQPKSQKATNINPKQI